MSDLTLTRLKKAFGALEVIRNVSFHIPSGEFVVFVGPSGCGKSTLLRMIAGLEAVTEGLVEIDNTIVNDIAPAKRGIAMVFQNYALYPHMTVYDNMAFGLSLAKVPKSEIDASVRKAAEMLLLTPYLKRFPKQLSGGQRQRVAIGRAITRNPKIFLFDEPLSNLDAALRVATRVELAKLKVSMPNTTMIYVTHDQVEAMTLADRIVVMNRGEVEQIGSPLELYHRPCNTFVAGFIGSPAMNFVEAELALDRHGAIAAKRGETFIPMSAEIPARDVGQSIKVGVRPEDLKIAAPGHEQFSGVVDLVEHLGENALIHVDIGASTPLIAKLADGDNFARGHTIRLAAPASRIHAFDATGSAYPRTGAITGDLPKVTYLKAGSA